MKQLITLIKVFFIGEIRFGQTLTNKKLDSLISKTISNHSIPSMVVAVIKLDFIYYGIQGNTRIDTTQRVSLTDKYHIRSNTKALTIY